MRDVVRPALVVLLAFGLFAVISIPALAQSGSRGYPPTVSRTRPQPPAGSGRRTQRHAPIALEGYCPVSLQAMKKWVKGVPSIQTVFDGHTYYFANQKGQKMFLAEPAKYVPVLGGDCVVSLVKMGRRAPGNIRKAALNNGRLFLFANAEGKKMFLADPQTYVNADLAYGGNCVVCSLNMRQAVAGRPEYTVIHKGLRYQFPAPDQRDEFLANPRKYEAVAATVRSPAGLSNGGRPVGSGSSSR